MYSHAQVTERERAFSKIAQINEVVFYQLLTPHYVIFTFTQDRKIEDQSL